MLESDKKCSRVLEDARESPRGVESAPASERADYILLLIFLVLAYALAMPETKIGERSIISFNERGRSWGDLAGLWG
ncbi:jg6708 [Pararge aegeria aegeria]|uniref:Jg6708 protein n=1 Tax=Pararge aegeria aegeria TaxID=348720 RepID=A0A8S4SI89_9NEOP|nr:jg6708 [Pararge aegeria aegeria]